MELGIHVMRFDYAGHPASIAPTLAEAAALADDVGATWLSVMDHWFQMDMVMPAGDPMLEGYTTLAYLAALTTDIRLSLLVTGVTYRHPALLAKIVATLDVLSGGRGDLGIGAAWYEREHKGLGVPFPPVAERFERLEETIQICLQMWDPDDTGPFEGRHYQLAETLCSPTPIGSPRPRIMVGGSGEKKTLRLVAQYADACNLFAVGVDAVRHKLNVLRRHCDDVGRDPAAIRNTILYTGAALGSGDIDGFVAEMGDYAKLGIDQVMVMPGDDPVAWIERLAPAVPRLAELSP